MSISGDRFFKLLDDQYRKVVDSVVWPALQRAGFERTGFGFQKVDSDRVLAITTCTSHQFFVMRASIGFQSVAAFLKSAPPSAVSESVLGPPPVHLRMSLTGYQEGVTDGWPLLDSCSTDPWWNPTDLDKIAPLVVKALTDRAYPFFDSAKAVDEGLSQLKAEGSRLGWIQDHIVRASILLLKGDGAGAEQELLDERRKSELKREPSGYDGLDRARNECLLQFIRRKRGVPHDGSPLYGYFETGPYAGDAMVAVRIEMGSQVPPPGTGTGCLAGKALPGETGKDALRGVIYALQALQRHGLVNECARVELLPQTILSQDRKGAQLAFILAMTVWNAFGFLPPDLPSISAAESLFPS